MIKKPELLSPAGDMERLQAAVQYGADAVYMAGKQFGMRAAPANFGEDELSQAVRYCHDHGVKVYLTCNTLPTNAEADVLPQFIRSSASAGVDAFIAADLGVMMLAKRLAPEVDVHISTQAGVVNYLTARELYNLGASRVILARELSLDEIAELRDKTPPELEIEAFVHGAMCVSFSGRCLLSTYLSHRDGNRGQCSQPCRWGYHLVEEKRPGQYFPIYEDEKGSFILNAQDMCMLSHLDRLYQAGISSFKIEGRAKSAYYVAAVTGAYRQAVDLLMEEPENYNPPQWLQEEICKVSHRQYSTGFYFPEQPPQQYYNNRGYVRRWEVVATVDGWSDGELHCLERNRFSVGEELEIMYPGSRPEPLQVEVMYDEERQSIEVARHPMMRLFIPSEKEYPAGAVLRRQVMEEDA